MHIRALCNHCFKTGTVLDTRLKPIIKPFHKKAKSRSPHQNNYRGIALQSFIASVQLNALRFFSGGEESLSFSCMAYIFGESGWVPWVPYKNVMMVKFNIFCERIMKMDRLRKIICSWDESLAGESFKNSLLGKEARKVLIDIKGFRGHMCFGML